MAIVTTRERPASFFRDLEKTSRRKRLARLAIERPRKPLFDAPKDPATLDQYRWFDALCELSQELGLDTEAIPNNASRMLAQEMIDRRENYLAQANVNALAELHSTFIWKD